MKIKNLLTFVLAVSIFGIFGCHTYVFQPVEKQMQGTWLLSPQDSNNWETWTFSDSLYIVVKRWNGNTWDTLKDSTIYSPSKTITYNVQYKGTKHWVHTPDYFLEPNPGEEKPVWVVSKVNKNELYLSTEQKAKGYKRKSNWQRGFIKQQ